MAWSNKELSESGAPRGARTSGGITGAGGKNVNPINRSAKITQTPDSLKALGRASASAAKGKAPASSTSSTPRIVVKPAAKPIPNPPDKAKTTFKNDSSQNRAADRTIKEYEKNVIRHGERPTDPSFGSKLAERAGNNAQLNRKANLPSTPVAKKIAKVERKANSKWKKDMNNSIDG